MAQIMERVAAQSGAGRTQTMRLVYPTKGSPTYVYLGAGVFDVIVTWGGTAAVNMHHRWDGSTSDQRNHMSLVPEGTSTASDVKQRRGMVRVGSENPGQLVFFTTSGPMDEVARATIQIIPANLTLDMEITTS